jgi:hypothetical protein
MIVPSLMTTVCLSLSQWYRLINCRLGKKAIDQIFRVINEQSQGTFDKDFNVISFYNWTGGPGALSPAVNNGGNGEPKAYTGIF